MSISVQVLDISEYNELPTVANGYTVVYNGGSVDDRGTSISLSSPYTLGTQTFTSIYIQTNGWIQFLNATYPTGSTTYIESIATLVTKYGIAIAWDDLIVNSDDAIGYKYANNNTQLIVNYNVSTFSSTKVQFKMTINLINHATSPGTIRIALGLIQNTSDGLFGLAYGPASTVPTGNTMNYVVSDTPTNFLYPDVPVQLFSGTGSNNLTNKTIVYNIQAPNLPPVLSNNITISEIYGQTSYSVDLNNYTTDSDSSLSDVVYTLNPNGRSSGGLNNTTLRFWMRDIYSGAYGDTWNGGKAVIRNSSNSVVATLTGPSLNNPLWIYQDIVLSGVNTITWTVGQYPEEPQLFVTSPSYSWATSNGDPPAISSEVYYRTVGISNRTDTLNINITQTKPLLGVSISGSVLTLNSTLYNCDEFYITANNTGIAITSNIATCSFTRLTAEQIAEAPSTSTYNGSGELTSSIVTSSLNNNPRPIVIIIGYSSIGASAFQDASGVTSITIPSSITSIGASAFQGMTGLTSITIPSSVTSIGSSAFQGMTGLTSITIPSSVTSIGTSAFLGSGITTAIFAESTILDGLTPSIIPGTNILYGVYGKSGITVSWLTKVFNGSGPLSGATALLYGVPNVRIVTYTSIGESAFQDASGITSITIPSSVTSIGASAFQGMIGLTSITIPSSVTSIGASAFQGMTSLTSISIPSSVTSIGSDAFQGSGIKSVIIQSGMLVIPTSAFQGMTGITSVTIPSSVTSIGASAFQGMTGLTTISIPSSVTSIGASAFQGMTGLTSITIPSSVTSIGENAFQGMTSLTSITIPSSVTSIGENAFQSSGITTATFEVSTLLDGLSMTNGPNKTLYGKSDMSIYLSSKAFNGTGELNSTIVNDNLLSYVRNLTITGFSSIGANAFQDATGLTSITLPSSVTSIGTNAFQGSGLTRAIFTVNTNVSTVGSTLSNTLQTFFGKSGVTVSALDTKIFSGSAAVALSNATAQLDEKTNVVIEGYTNIAASAFLNASNITSVTIPGGVTAINSAAFQNATSLTSITIPASVAFISATSVFRNALSLTSINVHANNTTYYSDNGVLYNFAKNTLIQYPVGNTQTSYTILSTVTTINSYAFYGANNLKSVTLPDTSTFTSIGNYAFQSALGLTSITIPSNVTYIGLNAFQYATSLTTVTFSGTSKLNTIGSSAFQNATSLTSITIPASVISIPESSNVFQNALSLTSIIVDPNNPNYYSDSYGVLYNYSKTTIIQYPVGNTQTSYTILSTVTTINSYAFYGANNLKSVTLPDTSTYTNIGDYAFQGALGLTSITIPSNVTNIGLNAFQYATSLKTVTFSGTSKLNRIGDRAFQHATSLTSITIPASVTNISTSFVFYNATSLTLIIVDPNNPNYSSDGYGVLYNKAKSQLFQYPVGNTQTSYIMPDKVTTINSYAFYNANNLKSVTLPDTSTFTSIGDFVFFYATGLTSITIPSAVTSIGNQSFQGAASLTTVNYSGKPSLTTIVGQTFAYTSLTSLTIPASVTNISTSFVFFGAHNLTSIIVDPSNTTYSSDSFGVLYNADKTQLIQYPVGNTQTSYAIPSTVTNFNGPSFLGANNLTSITCDPNSTVLSTDSYGVLYDKAKTIIYLYPGGNIRTSYTIPTTVTSISNYSFQRAKYLKSINVDPINNFFSSDSNGVLFNKAKTQLFQYPLSNTQTTYSIPLTVTTITWSSFQEATNLTSVTIQTPFNATSIQDYAFQNATSLKTITIPNSVNSIGGKLFQGSGLTSAKFESAINYPYFAIQNKSTPQYFLGKDNVIAKILNLVLNGFGELTSTIVTSNLSDATTSVLIVGYSSIGASAFQDATSVTSITIPSTVTSIGASAFQGMTGLSSITIPSSVTSIGASAFKGMTGLTSITIPASVTHIGENAFLNSGITTAIFAESTILDGLTPSIIPGTNILYGKSGINVSWLTKVFNGNGSLSGATALLYGVPNVRIATYTSIGANAFQDASGVTSITIPSSVTSIGANAFQGMTSLTSISIPSSVTSIGANAFLNSGLTSAIFAVNTYFSTFGLINTASTQPFFGKTGVTVSALDTKIFSGSAAVALSGATDQLGNKTNVVIEGYTNIADSAFFNASNITQVIIPSTVTTIGINAFRQATSLTSITIPASVTSIGANAFAYTAKLESILVDENSNYYSSLDGVLFNKEKTKLLKYPTGNSAVSYTVPMSVETIEGRSFAILNNSDNNTLRTIILNSGLKRINTFAFRLVGILSIIIPSSVTSIEAYAFYIAPSLTSVTIPSGVTSIEEATFTGATALTSFTIPSSVTSIGASAFQNTSSLTSVTIPSGVTNIGANAFNGATSLTSITIPSGVTSIGNYVFYGASSLTSITIPASVTSIGQQSFEGASKLTSITIPSGVTIIDYSAFAYTTALTSVTFETGSKLTRLGANAFYGATSLASITIPSGVTSIADVTFYGATSLTSITIPSSVTSIGQDAFRNASSLTSVTIPSGVTIIGSNAFLSSGLTQATINTARLGLANFPTAVGQNQTIGGKSGVFILALPYEFTGPGSGELTQAIVTNANLISNNISNVFISGYTSIGASAFFGASALISITIPSGVTNIGASAFQGALALTSITIPSNVTSIGASAFNGASALASIIFEVGSKLTNIGASAFQGALALTSITIPASVTSIGSATFYGTSALASIIFEVGSKLTRIEGFAFQVASGLTSITIPSGVTNIGGSAFQGALSLTSITIPSNVTSIGIYAFASATSLTSIIFEAGSKLTSITANTFAGAVALTSITIPSGVTSIGTSEFSSSSLTTAFFESASTVNALGLLTGDLINGYTVSSFYGKSSVTVRYTEATRAAIVAAPAAIISNTTFTSLLTDMNVNISNVTSEVIPLENDPYVEYSAQLTIPEGDLSTLTEVNKINIIDTVKYLYATQLGVNVNKIIVTLVSGSIIANVNVLKDGITEAMVPICFPKGTPVATNQGVIAIEKLNPDIHTIRGKKIVAITQSRPLHKYIISIEKDAFGKNVPSAPIQISKEHKVFYKGEMVKAKDLVEVCEGVTRIPYSGETLYNVLMEQHDKMMINNVICETLDPKNIMAKICGGKYNLAEQDKICKELNDIIKTDNVPAYKKLYASLK